MIVNNKKLNILFTFDYHNKLFVIYYDRKLNIGASILDISDNTYKLSPITLEDEWGMVYKMIGDKMQI